MVGELFGIACGLRHHWVSPTSSTALWLGFAEVTGVGVLRLGLRRAGGRSPGWSSPPGHRRHALLARSSALHRLLPVPSSKRLTPNTRRINGSPGVRTPHETVTSQQGGHHLRSKTISVLAATAAFGAVPGPAEASPPSPGDATESSATGRELTSRRLLGAVGLVDLNHRVSARLAMSAATALGRSMPLSAPGRFASGCRRREAAAAIRGQLIRDAEAANTRSLRVIPSCEVERSASAPRRRSHCMLIARAPDAGTESGARCIVRRRRPAPSRYWSHGAFTPRISAKEASREHCRRRRNCKRKWDGQAASRHLHPRSRGALLVL